MCLGVGYGDASVVILFRGRVTTTTGVIHVSFSLQCLCTSCVMYCVVLLVACCLLYCCFLFSRDAGSVWVDVRSRPRILLPDLDWGYYLTWTGDRHTWMSTASRRVIKGLMGHDS